MSLHDALAAALLEEGLLHRTDPRWDERRDDGTYSNDHYNEQVVARILSDPAFREAVMEELRQAIESMRADDWRYGPNGDRAVEADEDARDIADRLLGAAE